jgi:hypothetical protein
MVRVPFTFARTLTAAAIVLIGVILSCLTVGAVNDARPASQDDWRRTASGWERATTWSKPVLAAARINQPQYAGYRTFRSRFDTHPAGLALLQLVGALIALAAFRSSGAPATGRRPHWKAALARSFRASAFGS